MQSDIQTVRLPIDRVKAPIGVTQDSIGGPGSYRRVEFANRPKGHFTVTTAPPEGNWTTGISRLILSND